MLCENKKSHCNKKTMMQVINEPITESALLVTVVINKEKLVGKPKADGRHETKEFKVTRMNSRITTLHLSRPNFSLFRELLCKILWDSKASARVSHIILIATLERAGFDRWITIWIEN